ncbi:MAG: isoprenylcysteine carboxylmethyltransferase family protein [Proteobacteria bacterium]|nr:isoprenylcysteine carboxylmethyltransferase family protein [Pseudomonadota bacterium]
MPRWLNFSSPDDPATADQAGVIAPPPLIALTVIVLGLLLDWRLPAYVLTVLLSLPVRIALAIVLIGTGGYLGLTAIMAFRTAGTHIEPWKPATALVGGGIYAHLRNPMYVGLALMLTGLSFLVASDWMLVLTIVLFAPAIHFGVVRREERYLTAKFGAPYVSYLQTVPRYGVPI